jgi:K+-sensing histidine kinase KdpD
MLPPPTWLHLDHGATNPARLLAPWRGAALATGAMAAAFALRFGLAGQLQGRPTLIILTLPIKLSAYLGAWRAGLVATGLAYLGASSYMLPPTHSLRVAATVDRWDLFFLVLAGMVISVLCQPLHRARRLARTRESAESANRVESEFLAN